LPARTPRKQPTTAKPRTAKPKKVAAAPAPEAVAEVVDAVSADLNTTWRTAFAAAEEKQAVDIHVLELRGITTMTDVFFICHGRNTRQNQAICDEIEQKIKEQHGERPLAIEGQANGEWILMDYGDMVVHIFSEKAREYYDLERLYRDAKRLTL